MPRYEDGNLTLLLLCPALKKPHASVMTLIPSNASAFSPQPSSPIIAERSGMISTASPTTPKSAVLKIAASGSLLIAMTVFANAPNRHLKTFSKSIFLFSYSASVRKRLLLFLTKIIWITRLIVCQAGWDGGSFLLCVCYKGIGRVIIDQIFFC